MNNETLKQIPDWMIIDAVRYAIGRMSYQVGVTCEWLIENWDNIPQGAKTIIMQDLDEEFDKLDRDPKCQCLGMSCDVNWWRKVKNLWVGR